MWLSSGENSRNCSSEWFGSLIYVNLGPICLFLKIAILSLSWMIDPIDDVTFEVIPGSMRMHHSNIHCCFARQFAHALRWSGHVLLKLPPRYTGPVVNHKSSAVVHPSVSINQSLAFFVNKHIIYTIYLPTSES